LKQRRNGRESEKLVIDLPQTSSLSVVLEHPLDPLAQFRLFAESEKRRQAPALQPGFAAKRTSIPG
jgi:hypothetical protein